MKPDRQSILDQVGKPGGLSRSKAAKMLGLSRQYVGQLVKNRPASGFRPAPGPALRVGEEKPVTWSKPAPAVPLGGAHGTTEGVHDPSGAPPKGAADGAPSLQDILNAAGAGSPGYVPPAADPGPGAGAPPPPPPAAPLGYDPEDAEAARELLGEGQKALGETIAVYGFGMSPEDPRLARVNETNGFLKIAMKRNEEKTAFIGKLTKGYVGLIIGGFLEVLRVARIFRGVEPTAADPEQPKKRAAASPASGGTSGADDEAPAEEGGDGPRFSISRAKADAAAGGGSVAIPGLETPAGEEDDDEEPVERFSISRAKANARGS